MEEASRGSTLWLGYNIGYFCLRAGLDKVSRLSEEFLFLLNNLRSLKLEDSEAYVEAEALAKKIATLDKEAFLSEEMADDLLERAFKWRDQLAGRLENKAAFWTGYNLIYLTTQARRGASRDTLRELYFLERNLEASGLPTASILDEVKSMQLKMQAAPGEKPLDEKIAKELKEACLKWRSSLLRSLEAGGSSRKL